jgi:hypothetical protein
MKKIFGLIMVVAASAFIAGCSDGDDDPLPTVAAVDATIPVTSTTAAAVATVPFTFPAGVPDLGTTASTTVSFTNTATTPGFSIASGTSVASGATTFGSCIFVVASSSFPAGHRLAQGNTVTVNPCNIRLGTQGAPADSIARARAAVFILGAAASTGTTVTVTVNPGGSITVNGRDVGTVTLVPVSG